MATGHGGNLRELAQRAGLNEDQILDFSASINPLGPPEGLRPALARSIDRVVHYPDPDCTALVECLARRYRVAPEQIVVGNGSTEIFYALARALPFRRAIVPVPSYTDYAAAVQAAGREVCLVKLDAGNDFAVNWEGPNWKRVPADGSIRYYMEDRFAYLRFVREYKSRKALDAITLNELSSRASVLCDFVEKMSDEIRNYHPDMEFPERKATE